MKRVNYAVTGAVAASYYGTPRTTIDVDFMVQVSSKGLDNFLRRLEKAGFGINISRVKKQLQTGYNVVSIRDKLSPHTADFILTSARMKKRKGTLLGLETFYQAPEALIVAKLRMVKATRTKERGYKDQEDIRAILANTKVNQRRIIQTAKKDTTFHIFQSLTQASQP